MLRARLPQVLEIVRQKNAAYGSRAVDIATQEYIDFVQLAESAEAETGEPVLICACY
jgi:hypothetical protein